ncbi:peptide chain release factor N(5)-glutamine methyltransferase [Buchnera aphidicola]|uniref:Release factor glutamine methyltransferase n=1 Tax=Buchnera aphidicola subsp. Melaphis rhois TaxID=118103 RepID=A0A4D6Y2S6_BUCMH|nr:peptide chain release factor N(5)-glutamine methyltransferase [Buchnera aphidicola]QCI23199.1 peptide chain release factor N(5)-glutamine methyltransferase [Buchnera aphidicola (Melaphis rhois)]
MNIEYWLNIAYIKLQSIGNISARLDSEVLLSYVLNKDISWLMCYGCYKLNSKDLKLANSLLMRRMCGEPIAYLVGKKEFWSLSLLVSNATLIPRSDTEILVEQTLMRVEKDSKKKILDLGTGCGCVALALASERETCCIIGVDCMQESLKIAKRNAKVLHLNNVIFFHSFWFSSVNEIFDVIVSNPPYVSLNEITSLDKSLSFEPLIALISTNNGLGSIKYIIKHSKKYLNDMGWLLIEHGWTQKISVQKLFKKYHFFNVMTYKDYSRNDRITVGQKKQI